MTQTSLRYVNDCVKRLSTRSQLIRYRGLGSNMVDALSCQLDSVATRCKVSCCICLYSSTWNSGAQVALRVLLLKPDMSDLTNALIRHQRIYYTYSATSAAIPSRGFVSIQSITEPISLKAKAPLECSVTDEAVPISIFGAATPACACSGSQLTLLGEL